jgi:hypothetical protein
MPVILVTWESEIRRINIQCQPRQRVHKIPPPKQPTQNGLRCDSSGRVPSWQAKHPEFKPSPIKKKKVSFRINMYYNFKLGALAHICGPSYSGGRDWKVQSDQKFEASLGKKLMRPYLNH